MLSVTAFCEMCAQHIRRGEPFLAYHHRGGFGLLRTGPVEHVEYNIFTGDPGDLEKEHVSNARERDRAILQARKNGERVDHIETVVKIRTVKKGTITGLLRQIQKMQRDPHVWDLRVVEFNGYHIRAEGGGLDDLFTVPIPESGETVDS